LAAPWSREEGKMSWKRLLKMFWQVSGVIGVFGVVEEDSV
jgi:hypothetical protein